MSVTKGYSRWLCDRYPDSHTAIIKDDDITEQNKWMTIRYPDLNGAIKEYLVCPKCSEIAKKKMNSLNTSFMQFMNAIE